MMQKAMLIGIAGGTGSGKSTFAEGLRDLFPNHVTIIAYDNYYKPQDDIPFVFERFYKGDKSRGLDKKGAGLGLYIAKTIISAHNEEIWVTSEHGKDCQFSITLAKYVPPILHKIDE